MSCNSDQSHRHIYVDYMKLLIRSSSSGAKILNQKIDHKNNNKNTVANRVKGYSLEFLQLMVVEKAHAM